MAARADRSRSPTPSDCQSWEEVEFPDVGEDCSSEDGLVLVGPPLIASAERRGLGAAGARSRSRSGGSSHARRTASPEIVSDGATQAPEPGSLQNSRNSGLSAETAARAIQSWWRTTLQNMPKVTAAAEAQVHSQDTDEDDEVLSEELDEEEDQDDGEDNLQLQEFPQSDDFAAEQYASVKEIQVLDKHLKDEAMTEPLRRRASSTDEEPGAEPEAEADSLNSPKKVVREPWASHLAEAVPQMEGGKMHFESTSPPQLLTMGQLPMAWRIGAAIAFGAVLALCLTPSAKPVTVVLPAAAPIQGACAAEEAIALARESATFTTHATVPATGEGNGSYGTELGTDGAVAELLEAMRQDIEAARRTAAAALREAMDAQSSWLTEAKARREAEWAAAEVRKQLQRLQEEAAKGNAPADPNNGSGSQIQKRNPLQRLHRASLPNHYEEGRLPPPPPGLLPGAEQSTSRLAGQEGKSLWLFQSWAAGLAQLQHMQQQLEPEEDEYDADDQLILFGAKGAAPAPDSEPDCQQGLKDLILWPPQDQVERPEAALARRPSPSVEAAETKGGLDITPAPSLASTPAPRLLLDAPKRDREESLGMLATVRAAWRRHWQGEASSISAKAAAAAGQAQVQAPSPAPALSPGRAETPQPSLADPAAPAPGLLRLAHLHSKLELKPSFFDLQQELPQQQQSGLVKRLALKSQQEIALERTQMQRKEVLQQPVQQQQPADEQKQQQPADEQKLFGYFWPHLNQPAYPSDVTKIRDLLPAHRQKQQQEDSHQALLQKRAEPLLLQHNRFPDHVAHPGRSYPGLADTATDRLEAHRKLKGQRQQQERESQLELTKQVLLQAQQQAEEAWAKAATKLGERTDHFLAKAGAWAAEAGRAGAQQAEQVRQKANEVQRQALRNAKTAEQRAQHKLRQAQKKAESIVEKARLKASWHLERARQTAETEASKARKYAANKLAEAYSSKFFEAWHF